MKTFRCSRTRWNKSRSLQAFTITRNRIPFSQFSGLDTLVFIFSFCDLWDFGHRIPVTHGIVSQPSTFATTVLRHIRHRNPCRVELLPGRRRVWRRGSGTEVRRGRTAGSRWRIDRKLRQSLCRLSLGTGLAECWRARGWSDKTTEKTGALELS